MQKRLKDYFIPHKGNDFKPHSLQRAAVLGMMVLVVLSFTIANLQSMIWINSDWLVSTVLPSVIVDLTNDERQGGSLFSLRRSSTLDQAARLKAEHMAANQYFAHNSPGGVAPWHWFGRVNYSFVHAGENLAIHFTDSGDVVDAWMASPTHRANIMNGNFTEIGVGTAHGEFQGFKTVYVVQLFGTPSAGTRAPAPTPAPPAQVVTTPEPTPFVAETEVVEVPAEVSAETAVVTETVDLIAAEPELVVVEEEVVADPVTIAVSDDTVSVYTDLVTTTTGGAPASIEPEVAPERQTSFVAELLTQPHTVLQILYATIAIFVVLSLFLAIIIEIRRQEPVQVAYAIVLLTIMYGLMEFHLFLSEGAVVL